MSAHNDLQAAVDASGRQWVQVAMLHMPEDLRWGLACRNCRQFWPCQTYRLVPIAARAEAFAETFGAPASWTIDDDTVHLWQGSMLAAKACVAANLAMGHGAHIVWDTAPDEYLVEIKLHIPDD